jgi:hypothetical protein
MNPRIGLCALALLIGCREPQETQASPPPSNTTQSAQAFSPNGLIKSSPLTGYKGRATVLTNASPKPLDDLDKVLVIHNQAELEQYLMPDPALKPEPVDFSKSYVLLTAKLTDASSYLGHVDFLSMIDGNLFIEYRFSVMHNSAPKLKASLRPEFTLTRFDRVKYQSIQLAITVLNPSDH